MQLRQTRSMCNALKDPFEFFNTTTAPNFDGFLSDGISDDELAKQRYAFINLGNPQSNLDPDELALYILVICFSLAQFILIIRYFLRLQVYFDRL